MNWRIANHPMEKYIIKSFSKNDKLVESVFILAIKERKHNGKIGDVIDTIFDSQYKIDIPALFRKAVKDSFYNTKVDILLAWCFEHSQNFDLYKKWIF